MSKCSSVDDRLVATPLGSIPWGRIRRAVESHDALLAACNLAFDNIPDDRMVYSNGTHGDRVYITDVLRAAIAKAEGKSDA